MYSWTQKLITTSLDALLGNDQVGQQEEQKFFVFFEHNAIIRIDVKACTKTIYLYAILYLHSPVSLAGLAIQFFREGRDD